MSQIKTPWGGVGYPTFKRTYSRRIKEDDLNSPTEEFPQTVERVIKACDKQLKVGFTAEEEQDVREMMLKLEGIVAGRFLWQLGTKTVDRLGLPSLQNCAVTLVNEPVRPFTWSMDMLMLGCGVGFNIQREYVYELPKPKKVKITRLDTKDADFIVPDTRQGWVELLQRTLEAHFVTGKGFTYSTICIRGKGVPIKGFGGVASGPEDLCWGITEINKLLNTRTNKKVRPIDCLDIMNIIGSIVVAGNVRRSAQIAIGDMDDLQFLNAKRWDLGNIPNWRAMSNNSVVCNDFSLLPEQFWQGYMGNGEPYGLINLKLSRSVGRAGDTTYPDDDVIGFNPCQPAFSQLTKADGTVTTMGELKIGDILLNKDYKETTVINKWSTGVKTVYSYGFKGGAFVGTSNHKVVSRNTLTGEIGRTEVGIVSNNQVYEILTENGWSKLSEGHCLGEYEVFDITVNDDTHTYLTNGAFVSNCAEQSLADKETCCLAETYLPNIPTYERLIQVLKNLYRIAKHSLALDCHHPETAEIVHKNMRMGIGITGYLQATEEQRSWLSKAYEEIRLFDKEYSKLKGFPESIKITTVKPSGTLSLLAGTTPGAHPGYSQYYIRRIRIASNNPMVEQCRQNGYPVEYQRNFDGSEDRNTVVVSFPCSFPEGTKLAKDMTAIDQLEVIKRLQKEWSDNAVSVTIYYKREELAEIRDWLSKNYNENLKTVSFLLHSEHGFDQAPLEEITKEQFDELSSKVTPITEISKLDEELDMSGECATGVCPIR